jgi:DNA-binding MarR family transcriptional regulator
MDLISTIAISRGTRDILKELGHKGQTYDQLIQDLIKRKRIKKEPDSPDRRFETLQSSESRSS